MRRKRGGRRRDGGGGLRGGDGYGRNRGSGYTCGWEEGRKKALRDRRDRVFRREENRALGCGRDREEDLGTSGATGEELLTRGS